MPPILAPTDLTSATLDHWINALPAAEIAGFAMVLLQSSEPADPLDGLALAAFAAARTKRIGLCAAIDPATVEPFTLARGLATLDHLSGGRAAWRLIGNADRARIIELGVTVAELLTSWDADALIGDHDAGLHSRPGGAHAIEHQGAFFAVRGPLNVPRPPQTVPPRIACAGDVAEGADLVLAPADLVPRSWEAAGLPADGPLLRPQGLLRERLGLAA